MLNLKKNIKFFHFFICYFFNFYFYYENFLKIGNVTERSELSFEYELKTPKELKEKNIDLPKLQKIPFQAHVTYTTKEGKYLRVISRFQEVTDKVDEVEKKASIPILANHATRKICSLSIKGK